MIKKRSIEHESSHLTFLSLCPVLIINKHVSINHTLLIKSAMNRASKRQFATLCLFEHINLTVTNLDNDFQFSILIGNTKTQRKQLSFIQRI